MDKTLITSGSTVEAFVRHKISTAYRIILLNVYMYTCNIKILTATNGKKCKENGKKVMEKVDVVVLYLSVM